MLSAGTASKPGYATSTTRLDAYQISAGGARHAAAAPQRDVARVSLQKASVHNALVAPTGANERIIHVTDTPKVGDGVYVREEVSNVSNG
jgi:hypothetical protein